MATPPSILTPTSPTGATSSSHSPPGPPPSSWSRPSVSPPGPDGSTARTGRDLPPPKTKKRNNYNARPRRISPVSKMLASSEMVLPMALPLSCRSFRVPRKTSGKGRSGTRLVSLCNTCGLSASSLRYINLVLLLPFVFLVLLLFLFLVLYVYCLLSIGVSVIFVSVGFCQLENGCFDNCEELELMDTDCRTVLKNFIYHCQLAETLSESPLESA